MTPRRSVITLVPTLATGWIAFAQVLSFQGLAIWVVASSLVAAAVVTALAGAGRRALAGAAVVLITGVATVLAQTLGGDSAGPVTRAALMATGVAAAMGLLLQTRYPLSILAASVLLLGGAVGLGSAGRGLWLVGVWAVAAGLTAAMLGPYTRMDLAARRRLLPFAGALLGMGLVSILALVVVAPLLRTPWTIPGSGADTTPVTPPPTVSPTPAPEPPVNASDASLVSIAERVALLLLVALVLIVVGLLLWRVFVGLRWRRLRGRLARGDADTRVIGAWTWVRLRRVRYDRPLPVSASPDVAVALATKNHDDALLQVARLASSVAFNPDADVPPSDADLAWQAASSAGRTPEGSTLRQRWAWSARRPTAAQAATVPQRT